MTILIILLCIAIVLSAVWADRSARARRTARAIGLNLCGIGCLGMGLLAIFIWSQAGVVVTRAVVAAPSSEDRKTREDHETIVRLLVDTDARSGSARADRTERRADKDEGADGRSITAEAESRVGDATVDSGRGEAAEGPTGARRESVDPAADRLDERLPFELSPQARIDFDARPEWVDREDRDIGNLHQISVGSGPFLSLRKARQDLYKQLKLATDEYINEFVGSPRAAQWIGMDESRIRSELVSAESIFDEKIDSPSFGVMHQSHALLEFGPEFHEEMRVSWHDVVARARLVMVALAGGAVLGVLALLFGYFNADTATRGFYSGRLKFVTAVAILGLIAVGIFLARSIPWLWL